jgi:hypothetical protein
MRKTLVVAFCGLLGAMPVCFAVAMRFQVRKHELSGVPVNHYVVSKAGQSFHVPRSGYSPGQRPQFPITATQYELWEENEAWSALWGLLSGLCCFTAVAIGLLADKMSRVEARTHRRTN